MTPSKSFEDVYRVQTARIEEQDAEIARLKKSIEGMKLGLEDISNIEDKTDGGDWDEIDSARLIARQVLAAYRSEAKELGL
jgi:hypothetical protein